VKTFHSLVMLSLGLIAFAAQAQSISPTVPAAAAPGAAAQPAVPDLPSIERIANEAQRQIFDAADRAAGSTTSGPQVTSTPKKTTFSAPRLEDPKSWKKDSQHKLAVMEIKFGGAIETVMFELYPQDAPQTVSNFLDNVETGAYKGLAFHRAIEGFIVQTGDPLSSDEGARDRWGTGGEGKNVPAEIKRKHSKGAVAMGRKGDKVNPSKQSNGYQFYFALGHYGSLDGNYSVFGQVISGLEILERISKMPVDSNDCPIARIEIKDIKISDHTGPLYVSETAEDDKTYTKPASALSPVGRFLRRVW
jgi:cyclophilin family peptidyl-prolyl cis-trans isomerase